MEKITSKNNPLIVETAKLKIIKHRKEQGSFLIEGVKVVQMALESGYETSRIFYDEDRLASFTGLLEKAESLGTKCVAISSDVAKKLAFGNTTQGIFAVAGIREFSVEEAKGSLVIALEEISDPGNMGTIMRTADAVGVKSILLSPNCVDVYNDKVIRASMGSVFNIDIITASDFIEDIKALKVMGYNIACGHLNGEDFFERKAFAQNVLIIGNEARGISDEAAGTCDSKWKLPMLGGAESLNAAVAAGIMMYDIARRK